MAEEIKTETPGDVDPEPEGVLEIDAQQPGAKQKVVPLASLTAERARVRKHEREKLEKEFEPIKARAAQADQLAADLQTVQPYIQRLKDKPELMESEKPAGPQIPDAEVEQYARDFELYAGNGLDLARARKMIARENARVDAAAQKAAQAAVRPVAERTASEQSRANFIAAAQARDGNGRALVDPQILAQQWALVPAELSAQRDVAELILDRAIGAMHRSGKAAPEPPDREPLFSEVPGGRQPSYVMSDLERKVSAVAGVNDKDWIEGAKGFVPGAINKL